MSNRNNFNKPWFQAKQKSMQNFTRKGSLVLTDFENSGYHGFKLYFDGRDDVDIDETLRKVSAFENYIKENSRQFNFLKIEAENLFPIDFTSLQSDEDFLKDWPNFKADIEGNAELCVKCMGLAMHQTLYKEIKNRTEKAEEPIKLNRIKARIINHQPIELLRNIKVNYMGKLVTVRGTIIKGSTVRLLCTKMAFSCPACNEIQIVAQENGLYTIPSNCPSTGCNTRSRFTPLYSSPATETINWQTLQLQEALGVDQFENGRIPRTIECDLTEDLTGCCIPGDDVILTGVVNVKTSKRMSKDGNQFLNYIKALSIVNNKDQCQAANAGSSRITFNMTDYYAIQKIHSEPNLFRLLVQSLCPKIYGHEIVKAGLLLALMDASHETISPVRSTSHVLIVGDPGLGKSCMLQACTNVAPRGVYVCGNTSTTSGLTVTVARDEGGGHTLEAGALVLADKGCCCIDEFDKMRSQHACLLEAMEQQCISIAKAGITCSLAARTCILAAANPASGHYDKSKTVVENLRISAPLLSRFDLIFILLDKPDDHLDRVLSEHVLNFHSKFVAKTDVAHNKLFVATDDATLKDRLKSQPDEEIDHIPHILLRKYIAYAQKYVHPQLSAEAKEVIKQFYLQLRRQFRVGDTLPVTTRQLESLLRLTKARARVELREEANLTDALEVIEIMRHSLIDVLSDEVNAVSVAHSQSVTGMSNRNQVKKLLAQLQETAESKTKSLFSLKELQKMGDEIGIPKTKFYEILQTLNIQGFLLKKGAANYQFTVVDFV